MKPFKHARISAKKFGGSPDDYIDIHEFIDTTKSAFADMRHRAILHNTMGPYICARVFGDQRYNSEGRIYDVRDVAEQHILDDLGVIPTLDAWLKNMRLQPWMGGNKPKVQYLQRNKVGLTVAPQGINSVNDALSFIQDACGKVEYVKSGGQNSCVVSLFCGNIEYKHISLNLIDATKALYNELKSKDLICLLFESEEKSKEIGE